MKYIALLRGINVGGNNIIKMSDLKTCFEKMGFSDVTTYIQSGNVVFSTTDQDTDALTSTIEKTLAEKFGYDAKIALVSKNKLSQIIKNAPPEFGTDINNYRYDALFLIPPLTAKEVLQKIEIKEGVDEVYEGEGVLYFRRLTSKASQSKLNKIILMPFYKNITIRNWNTTFKLYTITNS